MSMRIICLFCMTLWLFACSRKPVDVANPPSPLPDAEIVSLQEKESIRPVEESATPQDETDKAQILVAPNNSQNEAVQRSEPQELKSLLEPKQTGKKLETAVSQMRPDAIREAAQLATFQKAMAWRYGQLVDQTEKYANILDTAFNFSPLLITQGEALIMPPMLAKAGASMRIEGNDTATSAKATYELLEPARYIASAPTWRQFLMVDSFPQPEEPNPALLPRTSAEKDIWRKAVHKAWSEGVTQADHLYEDNVARMTREYRGIMLYHLLTAEHLLSNLATASADMGRHISGNKLNIGQHVYRITKPSSFIAAPGNTPSKISRKRRSK